VLALSFVCADPKGCLNVMIITINNHHKSGSGYFTLGLFLLIFFTTPIEQAAFQKSHEVIWLCESIHRKN